MTTQTNERTFFCSELVAKAFKQLKIIKTTSPASSMFYPSHFTSSGDSFLQLRDGITIDMEETLMLHDEWWPQKMPSDDIREHNKCQEYTEISPHKNWNWESGPKAIAY